MGWPHLGDHCRRDRGAFMACLHTYPNRYCCWIDHKILFNASPGYARDFLVWLDIAAPPLALAQAIGRWGNFVNQELYGPPTDLPWGIPIDPPYRLPGYEQYTHFHPLFLYESLWSLMNMAILLWVGRRFEKNLIPGDIFLGYLIIYPMGRFFLEFIRLDSAQIAGINANQTFMLVVAAVAAFAILFRHWRQKRA
jgi:phosphatidylglycerol:prolipoprotein diacylglycerol transferase